MGPSSAWRAFKRTEDCACAFASLIYLAAAIEAWRMLPGSVGLKAVVILVAPGAFLILCLAALLAVPPWRRLLSRFVWLSFSSGFGQSPLSVLSGLAVLVVAAGFIYLQISGVAHGGRYPAGVFSGYGAGIGALYAQAILVRSLERDPTLRSRI